MEMLQELVLFALQAVILAAVPILTALAVTFIRKKTAHVAAQTSNETIKHCMEELGDAVSAAVAATGNAYVDSLKKNGVFSTEEQRAALEKAKMTALTTLTPATRALLTTMYSDLPSLLETKIEEAVRTNKKE